MDSNHSSSYGRDYGIVDNCVPVTVAREILQKQVQDKTSLNRSISQFEIEITFELSLPASFKLKPQLCYGPATLGLNLFEREILRSKD